MSSVSVLLNLSADASTNASADASVPDLVTGSVPQNVDVTTSTTSHPTCPAPEIKRARCRVGVVGESERNFAKSMSRSCMKVLHSTDVALRNTAGDECRKAYIALLNTMQSRADIPRIRAAFELTGKNLTAMLRASNQELTSKASQVSTAPTPPVFRPAKNGDEPVSVFLEGSRQEMAVVEGAGNGVLLVGRIPELCDVVLPDEFWRASRLHCMVFVIDSKLFVVDVGGAYGFRVVSRENEGALQGEVSRMGDRRVVVLNRDEAAKLELSAVPCSHPDDKSSCDVSPFVLAVNARRCVVCMSRPREICNQVCGHLVTCGDCVLDACPLCRTRGAAKAAPVHQCVSRACPLARMEKSGDK